MQLLELITDNVDVRVQGDSAVDIRGLTSDSREVRAGYLFAAFPGLKQDGRRFIDEAVKRGASAVLLPEGEDVSGVSCAVIHTKAPRSVFAHMAATFYGASMRVTTAVTGTNGKSSTVNFCRQLWQTTGNSAACLGTLGLIANDAHGNMTIRDGALTTPDPVTLHATMAELETMGVSHLALEASSQGLDQSRLDGLRVTAAAFTNLTRDHLDYHGTMETYFVCKMKLFREIIVDSGIAVINADSDYAEAVRQICAERNLRVIDYGATARDIRLDARKPLANGQFISLTVFGEKYELELPLIGDFQTSNALCALGLVIAEYPDDKARCREAVLALERLQSVRGRLEHAATLANGAAVYVDYAHTPDGLETMLKAVRPHAHEKLHVVFGCGGDRDRGKRSLMGEIAVRLADSVIVTDDNPRTEDAAFVRSEVMQGATGATEIGGRRDAIRAAVRALGSGDVLVIAGKGHEQGQIVGKEILPFDDVSEVKNAVREVEG